MNVLEFFVVIGIIFGIYWPISRAIKKHNEGRPSIKTMNWNDYKYYFTVSLIKSSDKSITIYKAYIKKHKEVSVSIGEYGSNGRNDSIRIAKVKRGNILFGQGVPTNFFLFIDKIDNDKPIDNAIYIFKTSDGKCTYPNNN